MTNAMSAMKRRRLCCSPERLTAICHSDSLTVLNLPPELLALVFRMCPLSQVAENFRLVCRRFRAVATEVLNSGLASLGPRLERAIKRSEQGLLSINTEGALLNMNRAFNALEIIRAQFRVVHAVAWRYVSRSWNGRPPLACFYGGRLLDEFNRLLGLAGRDSVSLGWNFHFNHQSYSGSDRHLLHELVDNFTFHFEKFTERALNKSPAVSGARVVDLLDCLQEEGARRVNWYASGLDLSSGIYHYSATYLFRRSWFTSLNILTPNKNAYNWSSEQRFMYLRMRRMVTNHNDHSLEHAHYEREVLVHFQSPLLVTIPPPFASMYSGHGEYAGKFFYYGNMNERAYDSRFIRNYPFFLDADEDMQIFQTFPQYTPPPCLDLKITVDLHCPMHLAPLLAYETFQLSDFERHTRNHTDASNFTLKIKFDCAASSSNRLPSVYKWEIPTLTSKKTPLSHRTYT